MTRLQALALVGLLATRSAGMDEPAATATALRDEVLKASKPWDKAKAYKAFFLHVGRDKLQDLTKDADTGIALQAAWEVHKKAVKRAKPVLGMSDDFYDPEELAKFVKFLKERTKAPVPDWWSESIQDAWLFPGQHHAFIRSGKQRGRSVTRLAAGKLLVTADIPIAGFRYVLVGSAAADGKQLWEAEVWSAGRGFLAGVGYHRVELKEKDGILFVFGMETHGMYLEAFELATGKCLYRFCTCYWFHFSEEWGLK
jgi:hypothetical protein